jgi:hypothetical protein
MTRASLQLMLSLLSLGPGCHVAIAASYVTNAEERCVEDVVAAFDRIELRGEPMGFNVNKDLINPSSGSHWQGIARHPYAGNYFYVSKNRGQGVEFHKTPAGLAVVKLGSSESSLVLRSNLHRKVPPAVDGPYATTPPPGKARLDRFLNSDDVTFGYEHLGGIQASGNLLAVAYEDSTTDENAKVFLFDIRVPSSPVRIAVDGVDAGISVNLVVPSKRMSGVAIVTDGFVVQGAQRYVVIASYGEPDQRQFRLWSLAWDPANARLQLLRPALRARNEQVFQNTQLVRQCDGDLFSIQLGKGDDEDNKVHLFRVAVHREAQTGTVDIFNGFEFVKVRDFGCQNAGTLYDSFCAFRAGGGVYVDPQGTLGLYGVDTENRGMNHSTQMAEFWDRLVNAGLQCEAEGAWLSLYRDTSFKHENYIMTSVNQTQDDFDDFEDLRWDEEASSFRACLPAGCSVDLCRESDFKRCVTVNGPSIPFTTQLVTNQNLHTSGLGDAILSTRLRGNCGPIGGWAVGEPNDLNGEDCAEIHPNGLLNDASCAKVRKFACNRSSSGEWVESGAEGPWNGTPLCPPGFAFTFPKNGQEQQALAAQIGKTVWVNLNDREQEGRFVGASFPLDHPVPDPIVPVE